MLFHKMVGILYSTSCTLLLQFLSKMVYQSPLPNPKMIRKHSSRMPTARLRRPYLLQQQLDVSIDSVGILMWTSLKRSSVMTTRCHWQGGGPCTMRSHVQKGPGPGPGGLYSEVQCIMGNGHMGPSTLVSRQTRLKTLPCHNFVGRR